MAVLITGGKGFIGSNLRSFLIDKGEEVFMLEGDICDKKTIDSFHAKKEIDAVIHLAAVIDKKRRKTFKDTNISGTENIIELCCRLKAKKLIFLSSIRVFSKFSNPYVDSKKAGEELVINSGIPYVILRPSMVYGPGDKKNIGFLIKMAKILPVMPVLNFRMQPVFIDDMVKIIASCINMESGTTLNVTGIETISFKDLLGKLKSLGFRLYMINLPRFFSFTAKIFSFLPFSPIPSWQIKGLLSDEVFKGDDWPNLLKIKPTSFADGLAKTVKEDKIKQNAEM